MANRTAFLLLVSDAVPCAVWGQVPAGPEFQVNTFTTGYQSSPSVASDANGNFVVAWESSGQDGSGLGIFGQRFSAAGAPLGAEFQVNTFTTNSQYRPSVASHANGNFVVVWESSDGYAYGVFGQRFNAAGAPLGAEFQVNTFTTDQQRVPSVTSDANGNFVVAWQSNQDEGNGNYGGYGIFGQRFSAAGAPLGAEFRVNTFTTDYQFLPAVASDANGNFVVVWYSNGQDGSGLGVFGQRFSAAGAPLGPEFQVNTYTTSAQTAPSVASDANGNFVVAWRSYDGSGYGVFGQRFSAGAPLGAEFQVNTFTTNSQSSPSVVSDAHGNFVVAWQSATHDGSGYGVFGQRFSAAGAPLGAEFQVNTFTTSNQSSPAVASDAHGNFVVAWRSTGQDGSLFGVFGQRFGGLVPAGLTVDPLGNGVFEPGETAVVIPAWRNNAGAARSFAGMASSFTGPGAPDNPFYLFVDTNADYGTVPDGAEMGCQATGDCYSLTISQPSVRPALHWDASFLETISQATQGQQKRWLLHVGDSFTDVPRSNGFYRQIETLLHQGVTSGCAIVGDRLSYCPTQSTTREQMSKFVLVAKEGAGYTPPACNPADPRTFADVPAENGFCPFIEELFRRGVVNGCALGPLRYCPQGTVTREQMAKFVLLTLDPALVPPPCTSGSEVFADVPASSGFCPFIEELFDRGVVNGCALNPLRYCPTNPVTREQMSKFLGVTFELTLYGP